MKKIIKSEPIGAKDKNEMLDLLKHINNTLLVINDFNDKYENDVLLAKDELFYTLKDEKSINNDSQIKEIVDNFIQGFKENLNLNDGILFGYHYNIITYGLFSSNMRIKSNKIFGFFLRLISSWLLFTKIIGTPWLISKYILESNGNFLRILNSLNGNFHILWKYFMTGLDFSYFEELYKNIDTYNKNNFLTKTTHFSYSFILFIFLLPLFFFYNSTVFGFSSSPSWYNLLYQFVFILNIFGNLYTYVNNDSNLLFNIKFWIAFIIIIIITSIIVYFFKKK